MIKFIHCMSVAMIAIFTILAAPSAQAQEVLLAQYIADLGPEDHYTSKGARHTTFVGMLAQDRANYHRFGIRHTNDGADPIFSSRAMRAQIGPNVVQIPDYLLTYTRNVVASDGQGGTYMMISVFGVGDRITRMTIVLPG